MIMRHSDIKGRVTIINNVWEDSGFVGIDAYIVVGEVDGFYA